MMKLFETGKICKNEHDREKNLGNMKSINKRPENGTHRGESKGTSNSDLRASTAPQKQKRTTSSVEASIVNLFDRMSLAFSGKVMVSPRIHSKFFRGSTLTWNEKLRLNNAVWRAWNIQFVQKKKPVLGSFANPLTEQLTEQHHTRPQTQVLDGLYWKQKLDSVVKQYRKWRLFFSKGEQYEADLEEDQHEHDENTQQNLRIPYPPPSPMPASHLVNDDMPLKESTDTLFTSLRKKRFSFPDPKEIAKGASNADIIQPGLLQLQPDMDDLMDTDIFQELLDDSRSSFSNLFSIADDTVFKQESVFRQAQALENDALEGLLLMQSPEHASNSSSDYKIEMNPSPFNYHVNPTQMMDDPRFQYNVVVGGNSQQGFVQSAPMEPPLMEVADSDGMSYSSVQNMGVSSSQTQTPPTSTTWDLLNHQFQQQGLSGQTTAVGYDPRTTSVSVLGPPSHSRNFALPVLNLGAIQQVFAPQPPNVTSSNSFVTPQTPTTPLSIGGGGSFSPHISPYSTAPSTPTPSSTPSTSPSLRRKQSLESSEGGIHRPRSRSRRRRRDEADQHTTDGGTDDSTFTQPSPRGSQVEMSYNAIDMATISEQHFTNLKYKGNTRGMSNSQERPVSGSTTPVASGSGQVSAVSSSPSSPGSAYEGNSSEPLEFPVYKSKRRRSSIDDESKLEKRKARHRNCEIKRRSMLQSQLDELQSFLPGLNNPDIENKVTLATLLSKAGEHVQQLSQEIENQTEDVLKLKTEIDNLNEEISQVQDELPDTGVDIEISTQQKDAVSTLEQLFDEHIKNKTMESWKYWIFSLIFQPQFTTFKNITKEACDEDFSKKVKEWLSHSCTLKTLRKGVLPAMRQISTRTSILTEPSMLPEQALQAAFNIKTEKVL